MRNGLLRALGYLVLLLMMLALLPYLVITAAWDWLKVWQGKAKPSPFIPEHPESAAAWAKQMSRARETQRREENE